MHSVGFARLRMNGRLVNILLHFRYSVSTFWCLFCDRLQLLLSFMLHDLDLSQLEKEKEKLKKIKILSLAFVTCALFSL